MSRGLSQSIVLLTYTTSLSAAGQPKREQTSNETVLGAIQADTSQEAEAQRIRDGISTGKLYVSSGVTLNPRTMRARDPDGREWELQGEPVKAPGAPTQWVTVKLSRSTQ